MSTLSLLSFEDRLRREAPAWAWQCSPTTDTEWIAGTELPREFEIRATKQGSPVPGTPLHMSGDMLMRWGLDSSARMICNEITPWLGKHSHQSGAAWDKLAEMT